MHNTQGHIWLPNNTHTVINYTTIAKNKIINKYVYINKEITVINRRSCAFSAPVFKVTNNDDCDNT